MATPQMAIRWIRRAAPCNTASGMALGPMASAQRFHDQVVDVRAKGPDQLVVAVRVHAIAQQDDVPVALEIEPHGGTGEAEMADGVRREICPRTRVRRRRIPTQAPRGVGYRLVACPELTHDALRNHLADVVVTILQTA